MPLFKSKGRKWSRGEKMLIVLPVVCGLLVVGASKFLRYSLFEAPPRPGGTLNWNEQSWWSSSRSFSPDGKFQARVFTHVYIGMVPDDYGRYWILRVTSPGGRTYEELLYSGDIVEEEENPIERPEWEGNIFDLQWENDGQDLVVTSPMTETVTLRRIAGELHPLRWKQELPAGSKAAPLNAKLQQKLQKAGLLSPWWHLKYIQVRKGDGWNWSQSICNLDPNVLLVLGPSDHRFEVVSRGPVLCLGEVRSQIASDSWVYFADRSEPGGHTHSPEIYVSKSSWGTNYFGAKDKRVHWRK